MDSRRAVAANPGSQDAVDPNRSSPRENPAVRDPEQPLDFMACSGESEVLSLKPKNETSSPSSQRFRRLTIDVLLADRNGCDLVSAWDLYADASSRSVEPPGYNTSPRDVGTDLVKLSTRQIA
jgi:hypothetical protein